MSMIPANFNQKPANPLREAIDVITARGCVVEICQDIPGLFRIDGGPEITIFQVLEIARLNQQID
jgi:hypothetical protein